MEDWKIGIGITWNNVGRKEGTQTVLEVKQKWKSYESKKSWGKLRQ